MAGREDEMSERLIAQRFLVVHRADKRPELSLPPLITAGCARGETCLPGFGFCPRSNQCRSGSTPLPHRLPFLAHPLWECFKRRANSPPLRVLTLRELAPT